jgi:hypothetical protein
MTWAIPRNGITRPAQGPDIAPPSNWEGFRAGTMLAWQAADVGKQRNRQVLEIKNPLALEAMSRLGPEKISAELKRRADEAEARGGMRISGGALSPDELLELARQDASANPGAWADLDLSDEGIESRVTERRAEERRVNEEVLTLTPNPTRNAVLGGIAGAILDPINLALAPFGGGGGSLWRIMLAEAGLGAAAEAIQQPARVRVADELGYEAPGLIESMALGAAGGAILGGAMVGIPRAVRAYTYSRELRKAADVPGFDPITGEGAVRAAEKALDADQNPLAAVSEVLRQAPPPAREPLILTPEMRSVTATTPEPTALAPDPITTESLSPIPGQAPTTPGETAAMAERAIGKAVKAPKNPILMAIKRKGGVDPQGTFADELRNMGITHKTIPGLFKKGGMKDGDNLVGSEWEEAVPGISFRAGDDGNGYLDRNGLFAAIDEEMRPNVARTADPERGYDPQEAFLRGDQAEDGFFVNLDLYQFDNPAWAEDIARGFDSYLESKGFTLLPREKAEILRELQTRGGDAEFMVERAFEREIDAEEAAQLRRMRGEPDARPDEWIPGGPDDVARAADQPSGEPSAQPEAAAREPGQSGAGGGQSAGYERTAIGDQAVIPGTRTNDVEARRSARAKAEAELQALQSKQRRLNQVRVEDDVDGLFSQKTVDLFDDLMSPEAQRAMDADVQALRAEAETGGFEVAAVADDGRALTSLQDVLDEIDDMDTLVREFDLCRFGGVGTAFA